MSEEAVETNVSIKEENLAQSNDEGEDNGVFSIYSDLSDLPAELLAELNLDEEYHTDKRILEVFNKAGGTLNISELLIGYYRTYKEVKTRQYTIGKLYRMARKKLLVSTGRKGEYSLPSANENSTEQESNGNYADEK